MTSRKFFSLFIACALIPLLAAQVSLWLGWFHQNSVNKGDWVERELYLLPDADPNAPAWRLVYLAPDECTEICVQVLYSLQQLHTGLGRKQQHLQPLVMASRMPAVLIHYPALQWTPKTITAPELQGQVLMVNRNGLALLHYAVTDAPAPQLAADIRADLSRLMNYDRSGT